MFDSLAGKLNFFICYYVLYFQSSCDFTIVYVVVRVGSELFQSRATWSARGIYFSINNLLFMTK